MQMRQLNTEGWAKTYLIWDDESMDAALIDPVLILLIPIYQLLNKWV